MSFIKIICFYIYLLLFLGCTSDIQFDVLILNGKVFDGSNSNPKKIDVGIIDDIIIELGDLRTRQSSRIINAEGLAVAPGFIDLHAHLEPIFDLSDCESQK